MLSLDDARKKFIKYLEDAGRASATLVAYGKDIEQLLNHVSKKGIADVNDITLEHLQGFMGKLARDEYTPKSISRKTNSTKTFFGFLHDEGLIDSNPAELLKHPKVAIKAPRILSKIEYRALRDAAKDDVRSNAIIEVLLQTGVSISELASIKLADLDLVSAEASLFVPQRNTRQERRIPLMGAVADAIKAYLDAERPQDVESEYLFVTKTGNALLVRNIRSTIDRYFRKAGVENAKVNDLRHTFVAHNLEQGTSVGFISKMVGHKRVSTTERYLEYVNKADKDESKLHEL